MQEDAMSTPNNFSGISVAVAEGDALKLEADVLALKFAQNLYGAEKVAVDSVSKINKDIYKQLPSTGESIILETNGTIEAPRIMFYGVPPINEFSYNQVREFGKGVLESLSLHAPTVTHIGLTVPGLLWGLDDIEALQEQMAGMQESINGHKFPPSLQRITIAEINSHRADRLKQNLKKILPQGILPIPSHQEKAKAIPAEVASDKKRHVFVAMPFSPEFDDVFYYGIQNPVKDAGFLCERADIATYTGEIIQWIKDRISTAELVIADLSIPNPNVYLEVGYAWGVGRPTLLLTNDLENLPFDVKGHRCLIYNKIKHLEDLLRKELSSLEIG